MLTGLSHQLALLLSHQLQLLWPSSPRVFHWSGESRPWREVGRKSLCRRSIYGSHLSRKPRALSSGHSCRFSSHGRRRSNSLILRDHLFRSDLPLTTTWSRRIIRITQSITIPIKVKFTRSRNINCTPLHGIYKAVPDLHLHAQQHPGAYRTPLMELNKTHRYPQPGYVLGLESFISGAR